MMTMQDIYVVIARHAMNGHPVSVIGPFLGESVATRYAEEYPSYASGPSIICDVFPINIAADSLTEQPTLYPFALTQEAAATVAGFIAPSSSQIDVDVLFQLAIFGPFEELREAFPERAFWETVEEDGEEFYGDANEDEEG